MRAVRQMDEYRSTIAPIEQFLYGQAGRQPGDPVKAANLMIAAVDSATPPLRLMFGADAYDLWDSTVAARNADLGAWHTLASAPGARWAKRRLIRTQSCSRSVAHEG